MVPGIRCRNEKTLLPQRGRLHRFHGVKCEVIVWPTDNTLNKAGLESIVNAVPNGDGGGGKGGAVSLDKEGGSLWVIFFA